MYAVGRIGSYITHGVNTVSGPFHPFGGAVDIIVVEQQDGSFKSSPWYVRFGKFQGVLKTKEKVVNINVNGDDADLHMYLDHKGGAYFLCEKDDEEIESVCYPSSSGEETDGQINARRPLKSKSCNYDASESNLVIETDLSTGKILTRKNSRRGRIMGLVFGRKSMDEDILRDGDEVASVVRADALERAEIAADLLEMKWSTNLNTKRRTRDEAHSPIADSNLPVESLANENEIEKSSSFGSQKPENLVDETSEEISSSFTDHVIKTSNSSENGFQENNEALGKIHEKCESTVDFNGNPKGSHSMSIDTAVQSLDADKLDTEVQSVDADKLGAYPEVEVYIKETIVSGAESFVNSEASESSKVESDGYGGKVEETLGEEVCLHGETLQETSEVTYKVKSLPGNGVLLEQVPSNVKEILGDGKCYSFFDDANNILTETDSEIVTFDSKDGCGISSLSNSFSPVQDEDYPKEGEKLSNPQHSLDSIGSLQELIGDKSEEEQLLFGDFDDFEISKFTCTESISANQQEKDDQSSLLLKETQASFTSSDPSFESYSSLDKSVQENLPTDLEDPKQKSGILSTPIDISCKEVDISESRRVVESLPNMWSHEDGMNGNSLYPTVAYSLDSNAKSSKWAFLRKDVSTLVKLNADQELQLSQVEPLSKDSQTPEELSHLPVDVVLGDTSEVIDAAGGSWRLWPFSLRKSRSVKSAQLNLNHTGSFGSENSLESISGIDEEKNGLKPKGIKMKRSLTPTSEQLASLNLKEGKNIMTFTFSTVMLGKQQVDARIYLWKWNTRIVISDVDGTITKSDVLGQFMPLVGVDWSQTGVTHLFSAIKENGYQLLFLSARAISQAYHTRQFLFNLKQDGKALPDGPVVISPDGLFPSLFREVIRRAPHEFKISCLEDIKALFPSDCNPFYAGFGNRDTDEFSYLKVGIPIGKIFIINPKGQVAVNRRIDTKSYPSLHALVHGMFPSMSTTEQEDFNSWNFWKLPPPTINM